MNLVIDIGNTQTKLALFDQGKLTGLMRAHDHVVDHIGDMIHNLTGIRCIVSSVGTCPGDVIGTLQKQSTRLILLDHQTPLPFKIAYKTPDTLGHDRIAGAAGAWGTYPGRNVLIVDIGTAMTIDFISSDGQYRGGNISPGLNTRFRSLHDYTAKLPQISPDDSFPQFGTDTRSAIAAGVQQGMVFEIDRYVENFAELYPGCEFIITGGDAEFFISRLKKPIFAMPELVLTGLNYILEFNIQKET
jgi:type III pantothenate kinase